MSIRWKTYVFAQYAQKTLNLPSISFKNSMPNTSASQFMQKWDCSPLALGCVLIAFFMCTLIRSCTICRYARDLNKKLQIGSLKKVFTLLKRLWSNCRGPDWWSGHSWQLASTTIALERLTWSAATCCIHNLAVTCSAECSWVERRSRKLYCTIRSPDTSALLRRSRIPYLQLSV